MHAASQQTRSRTRVRAEAELAPSVLLCEVREGVEVLLALIPAAPLLVRCLQYLFRLSLHDYKLGGTL